MDTILHDLRFALRGLARRPGFTLAVVATLALGIGANAAIFSVVNAVLLRPLPYAKPDELVMIWGRYPDFGRTGTSLPDFTDWRDGTRGSFSQMTAVYGQVMNLTGQGEPEQLRGDRVSANFFDALGVRPAIGRGFLPDEEKMGGNDDVVVLSHSLWQRRFGGDRSIVGRSILLSDRPYQVVGIAPEGFRFGQDVDLWAPGRMDTTSAMKQRRSEFLQVFGRLKPGVPIERARADVAAVLKRLAEQYPETNSRLTSEVISMKEDVVGRVRPALLVFSAAVGLVLLIACANVANLLLARAAAREREVAVRVALGAGRGRLVRQLLTESLVLAVAGSVVGLLLAVWGVSALRAGGSPMIPRMAEVQVDASVVAFSLGLAVVTGLLFGLAPALRLAAGALHPALKEGGRGGAGASTTRFRNALVLAEVAVAVVLLVGAGLLVRSFQEMLRVDPGFNPTNVLTYSAVLPRSRYAKAETIRPVYEQVLEKTRAIPGVRAVAISTDLPMAGASYLSYAIEGRPQPTGEQQSEDVQPFAVSADYFRVMGIPLLRGRLIESRDVDGAQVVAVINQEMARRIFPKSDPIGQRMTFGDPADSSSEWMTIVGVVGTIAQEGLTAKPYTQVYMSIAQNPSRRFNVAMRTAGGPLQVAAAARAALRAVDPDVPLKDLKTMEDRISDNIAQPRMSVALLGIFASVALLLAAVGIYGVVSYTVVQRTREIGIRMALGARREGVLRLVVRQGVAPVAFGVAAGIVAALGATRLMRGLLYGVSASDPITYVAVIAFLGLIALVATYIPARRATRVDPLVALRYE